VVFALAVEMNGECQILRRREFVQALLQFERVGAHIHVLLACNQAVHDIDDLRVQERLAPWDSDQRYAAFFRGGKTLFRSEHAL